MTGYILLYLLLVPFVLYSQSLQPTFELQYINGYAVPVQNSIPFPNIIKQDFHNITVLTTWRKERQNLDHNKTMNIRNASGVSDLETEGAGRHMTNHADSGWTVISFPCVENVMCSYENPAGPETYANGVRGVWYRKKFTVDSSWQNKKYITLQFQGVNYIADVWLNQKHIGYHEGGYTPFVFNVTENLKYSDTNVIAIRIDNPPRGDSVASDKALIPYREVDWFNYTGVYRDVSIVAKSKIHIVRADIRNKSGLGNIDIKLILQNYKVKDITASVNIEVFKANFTTANRSAEILDDSHLLGSAVLEHNFSIAVNSNSIVPYQINTTVPQVESWLPDNPNLYIARINMYTNNVLVDRLYTQFGIRTLEVSDNRILVNNTTSPFLAGTARHEDHPSLGAAVTPSSIYQDLSIIKDTLYCSLLRTGHYPNHPITYQYADRIGLVTYCEIPVYWFDGSHLDTQRLERQISKQMWLEMIFSHYNSPSIWFWGVLNECSHQDERQNFISQLYDLAYEVDGSRLVMQAAVGSDVNDTTHLVCDVVGVNMYYGVFTSYGAAEGNYYAPTKSALQSLHANFPDKPILATEFGRVSEIDNSKTEEQKKCFTDTFNAFSEVAVRNENGLYNSEGFLIGCVWWTAFNWYTPITGVQSMGLFHMNRTDMKPVGYSLQTEYLNYNTFTPDDLSLSSLNRVMAYPNPWIDGESSLDYITFKNLTKTARIRIYDLNESLINELKYDTQLGYTYWNLDDLNGNKVRPGVYIYYIIDDSINAGQSGKIMVIR